MQFRFNELLQRERWYIILPIAFPRLLASPTEFILETLRAHKCTAAPNLIPNAVTQRVARVRNMNKGYDGRRDRKCFRSRNVVASTSEGNLAVSECLRHLAGRYVNNPELLVNGVYLESGPSGRFQVVITIEIGDILGDTID
jgi:hypothetical protein